MEPCEARLVRRVKGRVCAQQVPLLECTAAAAAAATTKFRALQAKRARPGSTATTVRSTCT